MPALAKQIGGDHYKSLKIQPVEYIHANNLPFIEGCIIKYATRWKEKGGVNDLRKIIHFAELLIELEAMPDIIPEPAPWRLEPPETAPRDMSVFLADVGNPWLVLAAWNGHQGEFVTTNLQADLYQGKWNDTYFENEYHAPDKLKGWMPLPYITK